MLGYGDFPQSRTQRIWLSSFKTSPPDYLSEFILQIKSGEIPVDDRDLSRTLFYFSFFAIFLHILKLVFTDFFQFVGWNDGRIAQLVQFLTQISQDFNGFKRTGIYDKPPA